MHVKFSFEAKNPAFGSAPTLTSDDVKTIGNGVNIVIVGSRDLNDHPLTINFLDSEGELTEIATANTFSEATGKLARVGVEISTVYSSADVYKFQIAAGV